MSILLETEIIGREKNLLNDLERNPTLGFLNNKSEENKIVDEQKKKSIAQKVVTKARMRHSIYLMDSKIIFNNKKIIRN